MPGAGFEGAYNGTFFWVAGAVNGEFFTGADFEGAVTHPFFEVTPPLPAPGGVTLKFRVAVFLRKCR